MTPDQMKQAVEKLLSENGYELHLAVIDQRSGVDVTEPLARQWQYVAVATVVKKAAVNAPAN